MQAAAFHWQSACDDVCRWHTASLAKGQCARLSQQQPLACAAVKGSAIVSKQSPFIAPAGMTLCKMPDRCDIAYQVDKGADHACRHCKHMSALGFCPDIACCDASRHRGSGRRRSTTCSCRLLERMELGTNGACLLPTFLNALATNAAPTIERLSYQVGWFWTADFA